MSCPAQTELTPQRLAELLSDALPDCDTYRISLCPDITCAIYHAIRFLEENNYDNPAEVLRQHGVEIDTYTEKDTTLPRPHVEVSDSYRGQRAQNDHDDEFDFEGSRPR